MTLEEQLGSILKKLKSTITNITTIENTVNARANDVNTINTDVQAKAEEMKKYVDTMNSSINTLNTLEQQVTDVKNTVNSTTDRAEKMLKETQAIRDTLTDALVWKGSVDNYAALPTENVKVGDTYNVAAADSAHGINAGDNVVWDGTKWDSMGGIINVDSLAVKGQDANFKDVTATTFHGTLNGKADSATTADVAKTVVWDNIGGKPATFPASKLIVPRKISITGNATGAANFDGSSDISINVNVNESKHAAAATALGIVTARPADANVQYGDGKIRYFLATSSMSKNKPPTGDGQIINLAWDNNGGYDSQLCVNNTTGRLNMRGQIAGKWSNWLIGLDSGNFNNYAPTKTGGGATGTWGISISGNAATATSADSARLISPFENATANVFRNVWFSDSDTSNKACYSPNIQYNPAANVLKVGIVHGTATNSVAADKVNSAGRKTAIKDGTREPDGLRLYQCYDNGYPTTYGNVISIGGAGGGELLAGWSGADKGIEHLYYRNRRDAGNLWSDWRTVAFTSDINSYAPTKTGTGASGTWPISISGNSATATTATTATKASGLTGNLVFPDIGNVATSNKISWNGSTDGADIYYQTTASDQGNLVLNLRDDANCYLRIAYNGAFKSYFTPADGNFHGNVNGKADTAGTADTAKACSGNAATATKATSATTAATCTGNSATATKATTALNIPTSDVGGNIWIA